MPPGKWANWLWWGVGSTEHLRTSLAKIVPLLLSRGLEKTGSTGGPQAGVCGVPGVCPEHSRFTWGWGRKEERAQGRGVCQFPGKNQTILFYHNSTDINEEFFIVQNSHPKKASSQNNSFA